ncbi:MAG: FAD:protein FMN transferase [Anaerolineae bacterium]
MRETRILMGMPVIVEVVDANVTQQNINAIYDYFTYVDSTFSTYKEDSEISRINRDELTLAEASEDMRTIFGLAEQTRLETEGYFNITHKGVTDPSGIVKGWAIQNAAGILHTMGFKNYYVDAGGDIQAAGSSPEGRSWRVGIQNPFNLMEIVKVVSIGSGAIATSGTYVRGQHIYDPINNTPSLDTVVSITVVGPNIYDADRYATAAFAMGEQGIYFIERLPGYEGYMIDKTGRATLTSGFEEYVIHD